MSSYEKFASVYDLIMEEIPYKEWFIYIRKLMDMHNCKPKIILDLGCGTGELTILLGAAGYSMIGVDLSEDMLLVARDKAKNAGLDILFLQQDMSQFELYGTVGAVVSTCDSLNYIIEERDLLETFKLVNNYLDPEGLFIFDINSHHKFLNVLGDRNFGETYQEFAYIWNNYYYEDEMINEYELTLFIKEGEQYTKYEEIHYEKMHSIELVKKLLSKAGLRLEAVYGEDTFLEPKADSERIYFVARECGKKRYNKERCQN